MASLGPDEVNALLRLVAGDGEYTVTWDKPQGSSAFQAIEDWFQSGIPSLYKAMHGVAPGVIDDEAKARFVRAYMQVKALGLPERRVAPDYYDDAKSVHRELRAQTDRAVAIVGAAFLDTKLESALKVHLIPGLSNNEQRDLFEGPTAPLGTFSGKMRVAYALGLIGVRSFADLRVIGTIRNRFAHKLEIRSFAEPTISTLCTKLQLGDKAFAGQEVSREPRDRFINSVVRIMHFIYSEMVAGSEVGELPRKSP